MDIEKKMEAIDATLRSADGRTRTIDDAATSIGALIFACEYLREIVAAQESRIERIEDALQNHMETTPRRRTNVVN